MAESKSHLVARALLELAEKISPSSREASLADLLGTRAEAPKRDVSDIAAMIRALCPPAAPTTRAEDVAALIKALCPPPPAARDNTADIISLLKQVSPADTPGGRANLEALIRALSPVPPTADIAAVTDVLSRSDADRIIQALGPAEQQLGSALKSLGTTGGGGTTTASAYGTLTNQQLQAIQVLRTLSPLATFPKTSVKDAVELIRALCPSGEEPAAEIGSVIAALSPADDKTVSNSKEAVEFIKGLCPAGPVPAADVAELIRGLSPADDVVARRPENVAETIRALCPAGSAPEDIAALIRGLSPADDPRSRVTDVADLIRALSPADVTPLQVLRTLSPAAPA
jgi:hypothetical protein